jgi:hypothetical protein
MQGAALTPRINIKPGALYRRRRAAALLIIATVLGAVVGAAVSGAFGGGTPGISGSPKAAVAVVQAYNSALSTHDWGTICNRLYSSSARAQEGGAACAQQLQQQASNVHEPKMRILTVDIQGDRATVEVAASVDYGPTITNTIQLVREHGGYRIQSAGGGSD